MPYATGSEDLRARAKQVEVRAKERIRLDEGRASGVVCGLFAAQDAKTSGWIWGLLWVDAAGVDTL